MQKASTTRKTSTKAFMSRSLGSALSKSVGMLSSAPLAAVTASSVDAILP